MIHNYGTTVHRKYTGTLEAGTGENAATKMPSADVANNATAIPDTSNTPEETDLQKMTGCYMHLANNDPSTGGNYFAIGTPMRNTPGANITPDDGGKHIFGAFTHRLSDSTQLTAPKGRWAVKLRGLDTRWNDAARKQGRFDLAPYWKKFSVSVPAVAANTGVVVNVTLPKGFQQTGMWLRRTTTGGSWWGPLISINTPAGVLTADTEFGIGLVETNGFSVVNGALNVEIAGLLNAPFALTTVDVPFVNNNSRDFTCPANFRLYGMYGCRVNSTQNYWASCWGVTRLYETPIPGVVAGAFAGYITGGSIRFDKPTPGPASYDCTGFGVRLVGVVA